MPGSVEYYIHLIILQYCTLSAQHVVKMSKHKLLKQVHEVHNYYIERVGTQSH